ncbi:MAG: PucR family transcriptional regulator, partial [Marmoricola sp.]
SVTTYDEPGVRAAALLTQDIDSARHLVAEVLGPLAADDEPTERLRETLLVFLSEGGSFRSAGERLHVHRNTVKYRVDRAVEVRGRELSGDRFNLELALLACQWLGQAVL